MFSKKLTPRDAVLIGILALVVGVILMYTLYHGKERDIIHINIDSRESKTVSFQNASMVPGEETGYTFVFDQVDLAEYDVALQFKKTEKTVPCDFIYVRISVDGKVLHDKPLDNFLDNNAVFIHIEPIEDKREEVEVTYYIPLDVGNEAQDIEVYFDLVVTATSQTSIEEVIK